MPEIFFFFWLAVVVGVVLWVRLRQLSRSIAGLNERLTRLEQNKAAAPTPPAVPEKIPIPPSPLLERREVPPAPRPKIPAAPPSIPSLGGRQPAPAAPFNWEAFMGVKLFAWLGGLALFLGVVFLVKYSFENNLITPFGRIAIGLVIGISLVALGAWLGRGRYRVTGQSLCATGIVILYADLFAAHSFYSLISLTSAFFAMSAVTLLSFLLAIGMNAQVVVILGLLGGFLTPVLLPSGHDNAPALFLYLAFLDLGIAAVALRQNWKYLLLLAAVATSLTQIGWAARFFDSSKGGRAFWIFIGFEALFLAVSGWKKKDLPDHWSTAAVTVAGLTALVFGFWISAYPAIARHALFFFGFVFLADALLLVRPVRGMGPRVIAAGAGTITFALIAEWIAFFAKESPLSVSLIAIVIFALLHAAATPVKTWRAGFPPLPAAGTIMPFILLVILFERVGLADPTPVFLIALLICAILLAAAIVRRADFLAGSALLGLAFFEFVWQGDRFREAEAGATLAWYGLFLLLFVAFPFCSAQKEKTWAWAISALAQGLQFWLVYDAIRRAFPNDWMGLLPAAFALPAGAGVMALLKLYRAQPAKGDSRLAWQGGVLLLFVSLIFPLQFDREWITLGWACEGVALLALFHRLPHRGLRLVGVALLAMAFVRLTFNPAVFEYHRRTGTRIWNWYLYAYGLTAICLLAGARLFGVLRPTKAERFAPAFLASLGVILGFVLLNLEIADYFSVGPTLTFSFTGNFARDMTYSIAWGLFALALIVAGMRIKQRFARYAGVALLVVTLGKLFLHDLSDLNELYRIGAFVGVAIILIAASFIYQRFLAPERSQPESG